MKKLIILVLISSFLLFSCKSRKEDVKKEVVTEKVTEVEEDFGDEKPKEVFIDEEVRTETTLVASIERTVCFGACPTYKAMIYSNGVVIYKGTANVDKIGSYKGKTSLDAISSLLDKAEDIGFKELKEKYDNKSVSDIPSTITFLKIDKLEKVVVCRFECDKRIEKINQLIEDLLGKVKFNQIEVRK